MHLVTPSLSSSWDSMTWRPSVWLNFMHFWSKLPTSHNCLESFQFDYKSQILYSITEHNCLLVSKRISNLNYNKVVKKFIENRKYYRKTIYISSFKTWKFFTLITCKWLDLRANSMQNWNIQKISCCKEVLQALCHTLGYSWFHTFTVFTSSLVVAGVTSEQRTIAKGCGFLLR